MPDGSKSYQNIKKNSYVLRHDAYQNINNSYVQCQAKMLQFDSSKDESSVFEFFYCDWMWTEVMCYDFLMSRLDAVFGT